MGSRQTPDVSIAVTLEDKYTATEGNVFMSGTQALVRLPLVQMRRDKAAGLNTGAFISGYRGSPLGMYDFALTQANSHLDKHGVVFQPGVNEDLAATAVWGSQQIDTSPLANKDGVVGFWYGKGPGVDRTGDVFKHANSAGTSAHGGVLALAGDDHTAKSSTIAHQSDHAFMSALMPMLFPSSVQEFVEVGLLGIAMSRYSGLWTGYKVIADTVETTAVVDLAGEQRQFILPEDFEIPEGGLNLRWPDAILDQDDRLQEHKGYAALAFARANKVDQLIFDSKQARFGIVASGKAYENVREALRQLGIDEKTANEIGLRLYKVRMPWPLEPEGIRNFAVGLEEVLVVEERREIIEHQIKQQLFNWRADVRPRIVGKFDHEDNRILSLSEEVTAGNAVRAISSRLLSFDLPGGLASRIKQKLSYYEERAAVRQNHEAPVTRTAHFCSGCPHNTSTRVPDGSRAMAGIGCHFMSVWMNRNTETYSHMGGEGVSWTGLSHFTDEDHVFANLGDGTYFHSGIMAIRQAVASGANITYKVLFNDAVAMTGGQTHDGPLDPPMISHQLKAEGVKEIWLISDEPERYSKSQLASGTQVRSREHIDEVQKHLRQIKGCTAIIYDQTCAAELRRRRKRGLAPDPDKRAFINPLVCEGCGDCSVQSNCVSIEPLETEWGRKRQINQSACNKDFSCVEGFCPSFVTVHGGTLKKPELAELDASELPEPVSASMDGVYNVAITGVGGTGVLTIGALLGMAAHVENKAAIILDMAGLAQKGGAVLSHVRLAETPDLVTAPQIVTGEANLLLAADTVVASSQGSVALFNAENTNAVINSHLNPVSNFIFDRDYDFREQAVVDTIRKHVRDDIEQLDFTKLAETVCGDAIATNVMMIGYAVQMGLLPLSPSSIEKAIELNAVAVPANLRAFNWGRMFAHDREQAISILQSVKQSVDAPETFEGIVDSRVKYLTKFQNANYADSYRSFVEQVEIAEARLGKNGDLAKAVALNLFKLMSYKDEYEVARLYTNGDFEKRIADTFDGDFKLKYHLAPPLIGIGKKPNGRPRKREFGSWTLSLFKMLAKMKGLRGGMFDIFGYTKERKMERRLIEDYKTTMLEVIGSLNADNYRFAVALARLPDEIRGFGLVKEAAVERAGEKQSDLLEQISNPPKQSKTAKSKTSQPAE